MPGAIFFVGVSVVACARACVNVRALSEGPGDSIGSDPDPHDCDTQMASQQHAYTTPLTLFTVLRQAMAKFGSQHVSLCGQ